MDQRISDLQSQFPDIFEKRPPRIGVLEEYWVIIDVPEEQFIRDEKGLSDDEFLSDLDRFEDTVYGIRDEDGDSSPFDISFPPDIDIDIGELDEIIRRRRPSAIDDLRRRIRGKFPGSPSGFPTGGLVPPPDALAVYLPFHIFPDMWGIYLLDVGVESLAVNLRQIMQSLGQTISKMDARRISRTYLFHHEAYHCAVESFSVRCELATRKAVYRTGVRRLYKRGYVSNEPHEETLATAYGIRKVQDNINLPKSDALAAVKALQVYMCLCPPEYAAGALCIDDALFDQLEKAFKEEVMRSATRKSLPVSAWSIGTYMMSPLIQRNRKYSWICKRSDFRKLSKLAVHYFRRSDVIGCLKKLVDAREEERGKHKHLVRERVNGEGTRRTQIPSGEVPKGTLSKMLRDLEVNLNIEKFREECRRVKRPV